MKTKQEKQRLWRYLFIVVGLAASIGASTIAFAGLPTGALPAKPATGLPPETARNKEHSSNFQAQGPRASAIMAVAPGDEMPPPLLRGLRGKSGSPGSTGAVLYEQYDSFAVSAVTSQDFETAYDQYDSQGADDFVVPGGQTWLVDQVDVAGVYRGGGIADSANVIFYMDSGNLPGAPVYTATNVVPVLGLDTGNFSISLSPPAALSAGAYWVSVQANERLNPNGQWFWRNRQSSANNPAAWRNPGGGFFTSCNSFWGWRIFQCNISGDAPDQVFRLIGTLPTTPTVTSTGTPPTTTPTATGTPPTETPSATGTGSPTATNTMAPTVPGPVVTTQATVIRDTPTPQPACGLLWRVVDSPNPGDGRNVLYDVAPISAADTWAVGYALDSGSFYENLSMHWDGSVWSLVPVPQDATYGSLYGVATTASNDVWAVGNTTDDGVVYTALALHWDGNAWTRVALPGVPLNSNLRDVTVVSSTDIWAVGSGYDDMGQMQTLTMHWDGTTWSLVSSPNISSSNWLNGVAGDDPKDVWAVGAAWVGSFQQTVTMHWDGGEWRVVSSFFSGDSARLFAVTVLAPDDVWAVGDFFYDFFDYSTLTLHWNGTSWNYVSSPQPDFDSTFYGIVTISPSEIWAAGEAYFYDNGGYVPRTLAARWNGASWTEVVTVDPGDRNTLYNISALSSANLWSVGWHWVSDTLVERYGDPCITPSPTGTGTPATAIATRTRIPTRTATLTPTGTSTPTTTSTGTGTPTGTATDTRVATPTQIGTATRTSMPTPTVCALAFTDVPAGSTFYPYIRCLACRGIINGYPGGTFRPNNNVTRGQLAKIVSNSAGFNDPPGTQIFEDVAPGSTFYTFIYRLASRGYMNGYPCGSPEPCVPPSDRPYFRPNNNATRGQISKIVSNAAGFSDPAGSQIFEDVPPGSTFYDFVQRLASRGYMNGYPCGSPEPCVPPENRPYFRPNNNATRGQTSKIVANTFFPNCNPSIRP
jgi:hypothetical protein